MTAAGSSHDRPLAQAARAGHRENGGGTLTGRTVAWQVAGDKPREEHLGQPRHWRNPRRVSVPDLFGPAVPDEFIALAWQVMATTPRHTYQLATRHPARMRDWVRRCGQWDGYMTHTGEPVSSHGGGIIVGYPHATRNRPGWDDRGPHGGELRRRPDPPAYGWPVPNVWLGVHVSGDPQADAAVSALLDTPAAVRWVLADPLAGPLRLTLCSWSPPSETGFPGVHNALTGEWWPAVGDADEEYRGRVTDLPRIDWVVAGGGDNPVYPGWVRSLRDDCIAAGTSFCFTQWGRYAPYNAGRPTAAGVAGPLVLVAPDGKQASAGRSVLAGPGAALMARYGRARGGRVLDGQTWDQRPADRQVAG